MQVRVLYFASLRDAAGVAHEPLDTQASDLRALYAQCSMRHGFSFPHEQLRVAVDDAFAHWEDAVIADSEVAFIPPVSGG